MRQVAAVVTVDPPSTVVLAVCYASPTAVAFPAFQDVSTVGIGITIATAKLRHGRPWGVWV